MKRKFLKGERVLGFCVCMTFFLQAMFHGNTIGFTQAPHLRIVSQDDDQATHLLMITSPIRSDHVSSSREVKYQDLLQKYEKFHSVWKQQPSNLAALKRYPAILRHSINSLVQATIRKQENSSPSPRTDITEATEAATEAAKGPVQPSNVPTSEDKMRKRMEATLGTHFPTHSLGQELSRSLLLRVPNQWIQRSCNLAKNELNNIDHLLKADTAPPPKAMNDAIIRLGEVFYGINTPPPSMSPSAPNG